jgi:hypothetical protein
LNREFYGRGGGRVNSASYHRALVRERRMAAGSGKTSLARRLARALARVGLDPEPAFQRLRELLLRPARHELGDQRRELDSQRSELDSQRRALGNQLGELEALRQQLHEARSELRRALDEAHASHSRSLALQAGELARVASQSAQGEAQLPALHQQADSHARRLGLLERLLPAPVPPRLPAPAPRVSIVMPTRDRAACIAEAIASVQAQQYENWELFVIDDGSRDATRAVVEPFLADARVHYHAIAPSGPSAARNAALREARGEFIAYLDSDNLWYPGFLQAAVAALAANPQAGLLYGVLATEAHGSELQLQLEPFDRARLERVNYIDLNVVLHRRALYDALGGFDETLARAVDWDLLLRYSAQAPVLALPVLAARYRVRDARRITDTVPLGPSWLRIRQRQLPAEADAPRPRVLYALWHYPQLSETYVEGEIRCLRRAGVHIAVWRETGAASPFQPDVPVFDGDLAEAVRRFQPDLVHVHWQSFALGRREALARLGLPVTVRLHGFDTDPAGLRELLAQPWLHRVYAYPRQLALLAAPDPRVVAIAAAFDTSLFHPATGKDTRLVLRASACLPSKDLGLFFETARRVPTHRFVFCGVTCNEWEHYPAELRRMAQAMGSPVELRFDVAREALAALMEDAGIYLHTIRPPEAEHGAPIGMPISIAEAMATGAYTLVRELPELRDYVAGAGECYRDAAHAAALIAASARWSEEEWLRRRVRASDQAFLNHADEFVLRPMLEDWRALAASRPAAVGAKAG